MPVLSVEDLTITFTTPEGVGTAVDSVSFSLENNETLGLVGESGCGKTVTALSILRLIQEPPGKIAGGRILFDGKDLLSIPAAELQKIRGNRIAMIFQEPMTALNPVFTIGNQIGEVYRLHQNSSKREARDKSIEMLSQVGMPAPEKRVDEYPHQLSGGMRQRAMIAMALACSPSLLIADEPTTALDVTVQAQILYLMDELKEKFGTSIIFITHDLGVVAQHAQKLAVMYAGKIVETGPVEKIFDKPGHPYTVGLMESIPKITGGQIGKLKEIPGMVPPLNETVPGCPFHPRCPSVMDVCKKTVPPFFNISNGHKSACHLIVTQAAGRRLP
ncbi:MAG: ABC transporter ATP-binding protein [bacterium]|nr:MAG: ABC transporter ATP-binding protein [bacterium]